MQPVYKNLGKVCLTANGLWDRNKEYERISIVTYKTTGRSYISKKNVPRGISIGNQEFWQPIASSGFKGNGIIILDDRHSDGNLIEYTLGRAIKTIHCIDRQPGLMLGFWGPNIEEDRDDESVWHLYQFNSYTVDDWNKLDCWVNLCINQERFYERVTEYIKDNYRTSVELADGTEHITLESVVDPDTNNTTYTIGEYDIASAVALSALTDRVSALEEIVEKLQEEVEELLNPTVVSTSYGTPTVTLSYDGVSASGGTVSPIISYSQIVTYTWSNGTTTSETITSGATIAYSLTSGSSYASINSSSGAVTVNANTGLLSRVVGVSVSVTLNSKTGTNTATITQAAGSSYITISPATITIGTEGGTETVTVSSNDSWTVE